MPSSCSGSVAQRGEPNPVPAPIEAMLIKVISRQPLINAFELDNGQIWEQSEAKRIAPAPNQKVVIAHGVLGAFFLRPPTARWWCVCIA